MEKLARPARILYALALFVYAVLQFTYADFRPVFVPQWQSYLPLLSMWSYLFGVILLLTATSIVLEKMAYQFSLFTGILLLLLFAGVQVPFELIADPYSKHLGSWTNAFKELALAGGAFIVAYSFSRPRRDVAGNRWQRLARFIRPVGIFCFCTMLVIFGIDHFLYVDFIKLLIPGWLPEPGFLTYLAGGLLIASGLLIAVGILRRQTALFLAAMLFLWVLLVHLPRAFGFTSKDRSNEIASLFDAIAFIGISLLIATATKLKGRYS